MKVAHLVGLGSPPTTVWKMYFAVPGRDILFIRLLFVKEKQRVSGY